jgi:hypothetical protein
MCRRRTNASTIASGAPIGNPLPTAHVSASTTASDGKNSPARRCDHLPPRLQARARRDRVQAQGLTLPLRPVARLAQDEEPTSTGSEAGGRGRLGQGTVGIKSPATHGESARGFKLWACPREEACHMTKLPKFAASPAVTKVTPYPPSFFWMAAA